MKRTLAILCCAAALHASAQAPALPAAQSPVGAPAYFIDGYHGGIYGHLPSWQTRFMVDKLNQYPDWKINLELEPESWDSIQLSDPAAYADFQRMISDQSSNGRIEYVNPAYGQSYMYNISGESIIRQLYYGMKTLRRHFPGIVFSSYSSEEPCFTSALPQILRSYGFKYASLKNPNTCWGGYTRAFGGELVNWIGPDGSSILTSPRYEVEKLKPKSIWETIASGNSEEYVNAAFAYGIRHPIGMCLQDAGWNYGPWLKNNYYQPTVYQTWRGYFENIAAPEAAAFHHDAIAKDWRLSQEDVLPGLMWGSQILQRIAREVRCSENNIVQAEKVAAMAAIWKGASWPDDTFAKAWRTLLLSQHHDCWIVPYNGKPGDTWADKVVRWTGFTNESSDSILQRSTRLLAGTMGQPVVRVYNTTGTEREEYVHYGDKLYYVKVPAMGYAMAAPASGAAPDVRRSGSEWTIETDLYRLTIDAAHGGIITSWIAKQLGNKELVKKGSGLNELHGNFYNNGGMRSSTEQSAVVKVAESDRGEIKVDINGSIAGTPFTQTLTLQQGQPRVDIHLKIDWKENTAIGEYYDEPKNDQVRKAYYDDRFKLLTLFPLNLADQKVYKNAPFDVTESHLDNTFYNRWDSIKNNVLLNWVDVTDGQGDYGVALFSDHTTSYAHGKDFPLGLTIQYSGNGIFYRNYVIDGPAELNYALLPHKGKWDQAGIWTESVKWNEPLIAEAAADNKTESLLTVEKGIEITSLTMQDNRLLVRLFNAEAQKPASRLYLGWDATNAEQIELDGRVIRKLPIYKDKNGRRWVELKLTKFKLATIKFDHA